MILSFVRLTPALAENPQTFTWSALVDQAGSLAQEGFEEPRPSVPKFLMDLNYDQWRQIRFRPEQSLWRQEGLPFELQFFHLGLYYNRPVKISIITSDGQVNPVQFSKDYFNYGQNNIEEPLSPDLGWAGFRIHYPIKTPEYKDEAAVFLGASYIRAVGREHHYGLSARGLAVDVAVSSGEEFPYFREFWIEKPATDSTTLTIYALLDSPSVTGAYKILVIPGQETVMEIEAVLFQRNNVRKIGIAPLTSMFFYGETEKHVNADFRPEVHDSDGLQIHYRSGEWLWRPLITTPKLLINSFMVGDNNLAGFGLLQRDVNFDHYQDLEARYDIRPSLWIAPEGNWGPGRVELIEIPTDKEIYDNVVAFWVPEKLPPPGEPIPLKYTIFWHTPGSHGPPGGKVVATRRAALNKPKGATKFVLDFEGGELQSITSAEGLEAVISAGPLVSLKNYQLARNGVTNGWRLVFQIDPTDAMWDKAAGVNNGVIDLRVFLKKGETVLTETWSYGVKK